ncbi:hypothetical protein V8C86DRAFT_2865650, partial [Haematococcus lacustris]
PPGWPQDLATSPGRPPLPPAPAGCLGPTRGVGGALASADPAPPAAAWAAAAAPQLALHGPGMPPATQTAGVARPHSAGVDPAAAAGQQGRTGAWLVLVHGWCCCVAAGQQGSTRAAASRPGWCWGLGRATQCRQLRLTLLEQLTPQHESCQARLVWRQPACCWGLLAAGRGRPVHVLCLRREAGGDGQAGAGVLQWQLLGWQ